MRLGLPTQRQSRLRFDATGRLWRAKLHAMAPASTADLGMRRGGRVVECTALEMRHTGNRIGSSNLPLSANQH